MRFLDFSPENSDFVQAGTFIDVKGTLQIGVYNNKPDFGCIVREIQPWVVKKEESNETEQYPNWLQRVQTWPLAEAGQHP